MYDAEYTRRFYNSYGLWEWKRLEAMAYGRLQAVIHNDFIEKYVKPGDRVLDAGSGPGRFSIAIAQRGARVTVLDIADKQLALARQRLTEAELLSSVKAFVRADVADLSQFPDASFNVVIAYGGALSYVCERRHQAAAELVRVTKPGGLLLVSVMSRYGAAANVVNLPMLLQNPAGMDIWRHVVETGDLAGIPSTRARGMQHPPMRLYTAQELRTLLPGCEVLEVAGSNVTASEGTDALDKVVQTPQAWATAVERERALNRQPGLVDGGSHIILAARRRA